MSAPHHEPPDLSPVHVRHGARVVSGHWSEGGGRLRFVLGQRAGLGEARLAWVEAALAELAARLEADLAGARVGATGTDAGEVALELDLSRRESATRAPDVARDVARARTHTARNLRGVLPALTVLLDAHVTLQTLDRVEVV